jgi:hypothetical protein
MLASEAYELISGGGATDFARAIEVCERLGPYCLIGGLAVNCFVEPVYTMDADLVLVSERTDALADALQAAGFQTESFTHSLNARAAESDLRIQFTLDQRYQAFLSRRERRSVLGIPIWVAAVDDIVQGKLWAWADPERRLSKRKKDELDLVRLAESYPHLRARYPEALRVLFNS